MTILKIKLAAAALLTVGAALATAPSAEASYGYGYGHRHVYQAPVYYPVCKIVYREFYNGYGYVSRPVRVCH